jgi:peptidoglycan/LPS O-acetylase OafA/YrhL
MSSAPAQRPSVNDDYRTNNFDLIRLFAALQVACVHILSHFKPPGLAVAIVDAALRLFPGVPIFFLISGLLISRSYERCGSVRDYYRNRCLRIFPALWVCLVASIGLVVLDIHTGAVDTISSGDWITWWAAQMSLFQQYSPHFLHGLRLNGSLWTIPVELEFYLLLPVLYGLFRLRERRGQWLLLGVLAASVAIHWVLIHAEPGSLQAQYGFLLDTLAPYLWMFLTGVLIQRNWNTLRGWFAGRAHWWLLGYVSAGAICREYLHIGVGSNDISPAFLLPLAGVVMSCAMSARGLSQRILAHNDISYGTYIYHTLVVAVMLQLGAPGNVTLAAIALGVSAGLGALSWFCVERPFLRQKRDALRSVPAAPTPRVVELPVAGGMRKPAG